MNKPAGPYSIGCWGCATSIAALILIVFMLTHLTQIMAKLNQLIK